MASTSLSSTQRDWTKCFLCQKDDGTALKTPGQTPLYLANPDELGASFRSTIVNLKSPKVKRAQRKSDITKTFERKSPMKTRRKLDDATTQNHCFICDKEFEDMKSMRRVSTFGVDKAVKEVVMKIGDSSLRRKISEAEDLIAMDAVYHAACLTRLYRKAEKAGELKIPESENDMPADECVDEKAFDAMIEHILEQRGSVALIFLISLRTFYLQQLNSFGYKATIDFVDATKLRHRIIERLPDIKLIEKNRIWYLFFSSRRSSYFR
ncbi:hypothetical protein CAPTEDRAFT_195360 [Capitella teleta]|uniref:Uncharacterized protein n=1 Tax=Capitella teleta TaxID=283909 RepID=R7TCI4_CAPTE|nr:hypothetical protein CAPTEDRAFT_195360 [Capitella teleta]|eukprot:ELT91424.1 hypothetical protein CAPTEDRAFT_195360 [Capitella teleta]